MCRGGISHGTAGLQLQVKRGNASDCGAIALERERGRTGPRDARWMFIYVQPKNQRAATES